MADNTQLLNPTPNVTGDVIATDDIGGIKHQMVKIEFGALDTATLVSTANPLPVTAPNALPASQSGVWSVGLSAGSAVVGLLKLVDTGGVNVGVITASGALKVDLTSTTTNATAVKTDGSGVTQPVSGTITANAGTGTFTIAGAGTAGTPGSAVLAVQGVAGGTTLPVSGTVTANAGSGNFANNLAQVAGTTTVTGGVAGLIAIGGPAAAGAVVSGNPVLMGGTDGTNARTMLFYDIDTGVGAEYSAGFNLRVSASGGSVEAKGQKIMASSIPVAIASDQGALPASQSGSWTVSLAAGSLIAGSFKLVDTGGTNVAGVTAGNCLKVDLTGTTANAMAIKVDNSAVTQPTNVTQFGGSNIVAASAGIPKVGLTDSAGASVTVAQKTMANSLPVVLSSDQSAIPVTLAAGLAASGNTIGTVKLVDTGGVNVGGITASNALKVDISATGANATAVKVDGSAVTQPVSGTVTVTQGTAAALGSAWPVKITDGANTMPTGDAAARAIFHKLVDTAGTNVAGVTASNAVKVDISATGANGTAVKVDGSAVTQPVSGTVTANAGSGNMGANITQISGGAIGTAAAGIMKVGLTDGAGTVVTVGQTVAASSLPVVIASNQLPLGAALANGTANPTTTLIGTCALGFNGTTWDRITAQATGATLAAGAVGSYVLGSDGTAGRFLKTDTSGNLNVNRLAAATGGATPYKLISAATTNATNVKASAGQIYSIFVSNINAAVRYLKLFDKVSAPTVGSDTPVHVIAIPGATTGGIVNLTLPVGMVFASGISFALTTGVADADTGAVAANEIVVNITYK